MAGARVTFHSSRCSSGVSSLSPGRSIAACTIQGWSSQRTRCLSRGLRFTPIPRVRRTQPTASQDFSQVPVGSQGPQNRGFLTGHPWENTIRETAWRCCQSNRNSSPFGAAWDECATGQATSDCHSARATERLALLVWRSTRWRCKFKVVVNVGMA